MVVVNAPCRIEAAGVAQGIEDVLIQALVSQASVEALLSCVTLGFGALGLALESNGDFHLVPYFFLFAACTE